MSSTAKQLVSEQEPTISTMRALVFQEKNRIGIEEVPIPKPGPGQALIRVTLTTICGTDLHILRGEYPVKPEAYSDAILILPRPNENVSLRRHLLVTEW